MFRHSKKAFTLVEMMIVISIIITLTGLVIFPYSYYMQRAAVLTSVDTVGQGWILAHKDIRNGKLFEVSTTANKLLVFRKGSTEIESYLLSGTTLRSLDPLPIDPNSIKKEKSILLDSNIKILGFSGAGLQDQDIVGYLIEAPYGSGAFFTGETLISSTGAFVTIGYDDAQLSSGRARQILLRPYLQ